MSECHASFVVTCTELAAADNDARITADNLRLTLAIVILTSHWHRQHPIPITPRLYKPVNLLSLTTLTRIVTRRAYNASPQPVDREQPPALIIDDPTTEDLVSLVDLSKHADQVSVVMFQS